MSHLARLNYQVSNWATFKSQIFIDFEFNFFSLVAQVSSIFLKVATKVSTGEISKVAQHSNPNS